MLTVNKTADGIAMGLYFMIAGSSKRLTVSGVATAILALAGCSQSVDGITTSSGSSKSYAYTQKDRACLERAMFFESNRSSHDGLVAVGTVVMNRVHSDQFPDTICGVVGQKGQFAPGVLSRSMNSKAMPDVQNAAAAVLDGKRHPGVQKAKFFHAAGLKFPYKNMHYVLVAGGNAFYEKRSKHQVTQAVPPAPVEETVASIANNSTHSYREADDVVDAIGAMLLKEGQSLSE